MLNAETRWRAGDDQAGGERAPAHRPDGGGEGADGGSGRLRRRWAPWVGAAALLAAIAVVAASGLLFVWPSVDRPAPADAIVVFIGKGDAFDTGIALARRGLAPVLAVSVDSPVPHWCSTFRIPNVVLRCFSPNPKTTQGESRAAAQLARQYHWKRVLLVAIRPQVTRARLRLSRCYPGGIRVVAAPIRRRDYPFRVLYEWGALLKALTIQRSC